MVFFFCSRIDLKYSWDLVYVAWKLYHYNYFKAREDLRNEKLISGDLPSLFRFDAGRQPFRSMRNRQTGAPWRVAGNKPISRWMVLFAEAAAFAIISGWWMNDKYRQASPFTWIWSRNETKRRDQKKKRSEDFSPGFTWCSQGMRPDSGLNRISSIKKLRKNGSKHQVSFRFWGFRGAALTACLAVYTFNGRVPVFVSYAAVLVDIFLCVTTNSDGLERIFDWDLLGFCGCEWGFPFGPVAIISGW